MVISHRRFNELRSDKPQDVIESQFSIDQYFEFILSSLAFFAGGTVDGRNPANQLIGSLSHYLQGFIHSRWCRISEPSTVCFFVL